MARPVMRVPTTRGGILVRQYPALTAIQSSPVATYELANTTSSPAAPFECATAWACARVHVHAYVRVHVCMCMRMCVCIYNVHARGQRGTRRPRHTGRVPPTSHQRARDRNPPTLSGRDRSRRYSWSPTALAMGRLWGASDQQRGTRRQHAAAAPHTHRAVVERHTGLIIVILSTVSRRV